MQSKNKPFHPAGMAQTSGGVSIQGEQVILLDLDDKPLDKRQVLAPTYWNLYAGKRLFDLFKNNGLWYVAKPWAQRVTFTIVEDRGEIVSGSIVYPDARPLDWEAKRYFGETITWDIQTDLPPDHLFEGDLALQISLGRGIYRLLSDKNLREQKRVSSIVKNLFHTIPDKLLFRINRMGDSPMNYLEIVYAWLWN